ncbi:hypothetical protein MVI01_01720 [Myxococcus virescens]|uniref:Uncharacterized protein n=1 Tax=Myxococcus virescens TaxID=83456 RepID=A0A511H4C5_9BACT|nr:hypothetical protein MVI01_01720 [Myxococcus virescens]
MGDEALRRELRPAQVATREARAADEDFTRHANGRRLQPRVQHVELEVGNRDANGALLRALRLDGFHGTVGDMHRRLGDAVHVDEPRLGVPVLAEPGHQRGWLQGFAAEDDVAQRQGRRLRAQALLGLDELTEGRGRLVQHRDALIAQQAEEGIRRARDEVGHHHHPAAVEQGAPELPDGEVERV